MILSVRFLYHKIVPALITFMALIICHTEKLLADNQSINLPTADPPIWSLKTNALPWAATIANIEGEVAFGKNISIDLSLWYCPWKISNAHSLKTIAIFPEGRWWFNNNHTNHFVGLHFSLAWFNLRWNDYRYQDAGRPLLGGGLDYGYLLMLDRNWGLEFNIGAGFMSMRYDRFYNVKNGALADRRKTSYWGIDRLGISVVYRFDK